MMTPTTTLHQEKPKMAKLLKDIIAKSTDEPEGKGGYKPKSPDEARFIAKHKIQKTADANGNDDKLFKATNIEQSNRFPRHGYEDGTDDKVYEGEQLDEISKEMKQRYVKKLGSQAMHVKKAGGLYWDNYFPNSERPKAKAKFEKHMKTAKQNYDKGKFNDLKKEEAHLDVGNIQKIVKRFAMHEAEGLANAMKSFKDAMASRKAKETKPSAPAPIKGKV